MLSHTETERKGDHKLRLTHLQNHKLKVSWPSEEFRVFHVFLWVILGHHCKEEDVLQHEDANHTKKPGGSVDSFDSPSWAASQRTPEQNEDAGIRCQRSELPLSRLSGRSGREQDIRAFWFLLQIEREMADWKDAEEGAEIHDSGTESDKDAREAKVKLTFLFV